MASSMSRFSIVLLCATLSLVALVSVARPGPVHAAYVKLAYDASLQETPQDAGLSLAVLPAGVVVTITGEPVEGFYPVMAGGQSGWIPGEALALDPAVQDTPAEPAAETLQPEPIVQEMPASDPVQEAGAIEDPAQAAPAPESPAPNEPVAEEVAPVAEEPMPVELDPETTYPAEPVAEATPIAEPLLVEPAPAEPVDAEPVPAAPADPNPAATATVVETATMTSNLEPNAPPVDVPDPGPTGPAAVAVEAAILAGPGPEYGVLGVAAPGTLVEQTGHAVGGYVTVRYVDVTGWVSLDHLGPPPAVASS
jgi:hypothetical protein